MSIVDKAGRNVERTLAAEQLSALRALAQTQTEFAARLEGRLTNDTLIAATRTFDSSGVIAERFGVAAGSIVVTNLSAGVAAVPTTTTGTDPAAGVEVSVTVPAGETWQLQSVDFALVTSAAVANRVVALIIDNGTSVLAKVVSGLTQTATQTVEYSYAVGGTETTTARSGVIQQGLPALTLGPGYRIRTVTAAIDTGDNYGAPLVGYTRTVAANAVTVNAAGPGSAAPTSGVGVYLVNPGQTRTVPLASRQVTLYGVAGDKVTYAVFTKSVDPSTV